MADFRKLTDVESVEKPVETANVLIEENGVIKKAPKTAVGGAGGDYDLVLRVSYPTIEANGETLTDVDNGKVEIVSGSYEAVIEKVNSEIAPRVLLIEDVPVSDGFDGMPLKSVNEPGLINVIGGQYFEIVGAYSTIFTSPNGIKVFFYY